MARSTRLIRVGKTKGASQPQYTTCVRGLPRPKRGGKIRLDIQRGHDELIEGSDDTGMLDRFAVLRGLEQRIERDRKR